MKKNFTLLVLTALAVFTANAQINFKDSEANMQIAGTSRDTITQGTVNGVVFYQFSHLWHFNTNKPATTLVDPADATKLGPLQKASTRKGWRGVAVMPNGAQSGLAGGNLGKCQNYGGGGDPVHFANVADLRSYLGSALNYPDTGKPLNAVDSAATCVFDMPNGGAAWAVYPGKYKKTDTRVYYNLGGSTVTSDLSFTIMTYDAGTSGKTVKCKMVLSLAPSSEGNPSVDGTTFMGKGADKTDSIALGNNGPKRYEKQIFTSSSNLIADSVRINVAEAFGLTANDLTAKKVLLAIITEASDLTPEAGKYDPVIALDNFHVSFWLDTLTPPTTAVDNTSVSGTDVIGKIGKIEISGAQGSGTVYNLTGQKIGSFVSGLGSQTVYAPAGVYIVKETGKPAVKIIVE